MEIPPANSTCSASSLASGEQLFATAARADYWFLLEHPQAYGRKALTESGLPPAVVEHLESAAGALPNGRVQLIRHSTTPSPDGRAFFVAVNHEEQPNLYEFKLDRVEDLLDLDLKAIAHEEMAYRAHDRAEPLFLVCTNGKRDACCARLGLPLYRALRDSLGDAVWQAAHVGGHRFAPNLVALPSGCYYGYIPLDSAPQIIEAERSGRVHLPNYRGRSSYAPHVQAADAFLRRKTGQTDILQFKLIEVSAIDSETWMVHFAERTSRQHYCLRVRSEAAAVNVKKSCREPDTTEISQFRLDDFQVRTDFLRT